MRQCIVEYLENRTLLSITPVLLGKLPTTTLISGQKISAIHQVVRLTNTGLDSVVGNTTITLQISPVAVEDASAVNVASVARKLNLRTGKTVSVPITARSIPNGLVGSLFLIAEVTDSSGSTTFAASPGTITLAAPTVDLAPAAVTPPTNAKPGRKGITRVTVLNSGNIAAVGSLAIDLQASDSGAIDSSSIVLGLFTKRVNIGPGKKNNIAIPAVFPSTGGPFFIVANVDPGNTFSETSIANNQLASLTSILSQTETTSILPGTITVKLTRLTTIPAADGTPQDITTAPGVASTQFITTRNGEILTLINGTLSSFLSLPAAGISVYTGGEGGLFGLAFSPTFSTPNTFGFEKFYTFDTEPFSTSGPAADFSSPELFPTTNIAPNNQIVIREWTVPSLTSGTANTTSRVLMTIDHPQSNHQGGALRFGPDGDLYIGLGDGGGANDNNGSAGDSTDGHNNATGNAQDPDVVFGKILRINPDPAAGKGFVASANGQYSIPITNPFAGGGGLGEIYALGLRNPFRFSFDSTTGKMYVGNVGQGAIESVDLVTDGGNYGWPFFEGTRNNQSDTGRAAPAGFTFTTPISEYTHADGIAVIGGVVDRNRADGPLNGQYVFGDLGTPASGGSVGRLFYTSASGGTIVELKYDPAGVTPCANLFGFGIDENGNVEAFFSDGDVLEFSVPG